MFVNIIATAASGPEASEQEVKIPIISLARCMTVPVNFNVIHDCYVFLKLMFLGGLHLTVKRTDER